MKLILLFMAVLAACILWPTDLSWAQCPEDPNDSGVCDTLYVELYPPDALFTGPGHLVRVPIYITHDLPGAMIDSIAGMVIPLCYTHTNPTKYCSLSTYWNVLEPSIAPSRSVFRDLDDTTFNRFLEIYGPYSQGWYYDFFLDVSTADQHFYLAWMPQSPSGQRWWEGSRVLAATMTFKVEDTMTVCLDSCYWTPSYYLKFYRSDAVTFVPRDNLPYCFSVSYPEVGDVNADGIIDVGDLVYLINYLYKGGPAPDPLEVGDCNSDGVIDLGDVVYLINYLFKGGPAPGPAPTGILLNYYGCKEFQKGTPVDSTPPDQDCIEYQYDGAGLLLLKHVNAGFNCCPDEILADITIEDNVITIDEDESLESGGCYCLCLFDVDYQISNLEPGEYTIRINGLYLEEGDEILQFTVDLASSPSGSFCVYRDHYPWGIW